MKDTASSPKNSAPFLAAAGICLWAGATLAALWGTWPAAPACLVSGIGAGAAALALARRRREPDPLPRLPRPKPARASTPQKAVVAPGTLLDAATRERLVQWLGEPITILEAAAQRGEMSGFNHARTCPGMSQVAAWRRSFGESHSDADALLEAAEDSLLAALIQAAEFFSPLLESLSRRGEVPPDFKRSQDRMEDTRRRTVALLSELRARLANLPVSSQESFTF